MKTLNWTKRKDMAPLRKWLAEIDPSARIVSVEHDVETFGECDEEYTEGNPECHICDFEFEPEARELGESAGFLTAPTGGAVSYNWAKITFEAPGYERQSFGAINGGPCCPGCLADALELCDITKPHHKPAYSNSYRVRDGARRAS